MFPLKDSIKSSSFPFVNYLLISLNIFVYFYQLQLGSALSVLYLEYGLISQKFLAPIGLVGMVERFIPLFSYMFLHGGFLHLFSNVYFLYIFGDNVEDQLGHVKYLMLYISFGVLSALTQVFMFTQSPYPLIGASGAVAGVMGMYMIFYPKAKVKTLVFIIIFITVLDIPAVVFLGIWFLIQFTYGSVSSIAAEVGGGTAWWAHIGGFSVGIMAAVFQILRQK